jgi:VIT1/CCC1 family predicted Fe2+/Mn2+ transporter
MRKSSPKWLEYFFDEETIRNHPDAEEQLKSVYMRNLTFGVHDSAVSVIGILTGTTMANLSSANIFIAFLVGVFVQAISDSIASYLSEISASGVETKENIHHLTYIGAFVILIAFLITGFCIYSPYYLINNNHTALKYSLGIAGIILLLLGYYSASNDSTENDKLKSAIRTLFLGSIAIVVAALIGTYYRQF